MMWTVATNVDNHLNPVEPLRLMKSRGEAKEYRLGIGQHIVRVPTDLGSTLTIGLGREEADGDDWRGTVRLIVQDPSGKFHMVTPKEEGEKRPPSTDADYRLTFPITSANRGKGEFRILVIAPKGRYEIYATLVDIGQARDSSGKPLIPWNFWFFPYSDAVDKERTAWAGSKLRPFEKYEAAFGKKGAVEWERKVHSDVGRPAELWAGHCDDAARASVLFEEPPVKLVYNGVEFHGEELKLLAAEVVAQYNLPTRIWSINEEEVKDGPFQRKKPSDATGEFGALAGGGGILALLYALRQKLDDEGVLVVMDLRDPDGADATAVWNHAVFRYELSIWQPSAADWTFVECELILRANLDDIFFDEHEPYAVRSSGLPAIVVNRPGGGHDIRLAEHETRCLRFSFRFVSGGMLANTNENLWHSVTEKPDDENATLLHAPRYAAVTGPLGGKPLPPPLNGGNPHVRRDDVLKVVKLREAT